MRFTRNLVLAAAIVPLAGCLSFGGKPPKQLLTIASTAQPQPGTAQTASATRAIVVQVPAVPQTIANTRIPVQESDVAVAYIKDAQWSEPPARLFARVLADTLTARAGMVVLAPAQSFGSPSADLSGDLRSFGVDASQRQAVVIYDASLTRAGQSTIEKRRFEARVPVAAIEPTAAADALGRAANDVAGQVAGWVRGGG